MTQPALNVRCSGCATEAYPAIILNDRMALVPSCPACGREHADMQANDMADTPIAPQEKMKPRLQIVRDVSVPLTSVPPPDDIFETISARLQYLDLEIAKSAGYAVERKKLARMLAVARKT